jgi:hypothetical protein
VVKIIYEPLVVSLKVRTPVALGRGKPAFPFHFDSLVVALLARRKKKGADLYVGDYDPLKDPFAPGVSSEVPLAVSGRHSPVYQASAAFCAGGEAHLLSVYCLKSAPGVPVLASGHGRRRYEVLLSGKDESSRGGWVNTQLKEMAGFIPAREISFWCVGDREALADLLSDLVGIGACKQIGYGEVLTVKVEPVPKADPKTTGLVMEIKDVGIVPMRMLPVADWPNGEKYGWRMTAACVRPPYWHPANKEFCWEPARQFWLPVT